MVLWCWFCLDDLTFALILRSSKSPSPHLKRAADATHSPVDPINVRSLIAAIPYHAQCSWPLSSWALTWGHTLTVLFDLFSYIPLSFFRHRLALFASCSFPTLAIGHRTSPPSLRPCTHFCAFRYHSLAAFILDTGLLHSTMQRSLSPGKTASSLKSPERARWNPFSAGRGRHGSSSRPRTLLHHVG